MGHNDELVLEALGILGNLTMADLNYLKIVEEFQLVPFISAKLSDPRTEDDILLEVVILLGTLAIDESTAGLLASEGVIEQLIGLLRGTVCGAYGRTQVYLGRTDREQIRSRINNN